ncbi:nuclear transport factor 2 family protein [Halovivax sp.]|uniref:nuclear transport factor 2 family protein n=1 Tax=Halovivax sp. TaxID=1935978 RepID=UPI0025BC0980|nr:nuclear transport factor 2 family protein [Halovivax sp.]
MPSVGPALVRRYYEALDEGAYDDLESLLAPTFVQRRPDRAFDGPDAFVRFMREDRPVTGTTHELDDVFGSGDRVAARGRLLDGDGDLLVEFADHFRIADGRIARLETYTR